MKTGHPIFRYLMALTVAIMLLCCAASGPALADGVTQIKIWGDYDIGFNRVSNNNFTNERKNDSFYANQRLRIFIATRVSETLSTFTLLRILPDRWGYSAPNKVGAGYALDSDSVSLRTRHMLLNWQPTTSLTIQMGIIPTALPFASYRNGVLDTCSGGISLAYSFNQNVSANFFWGRPYASNDNTATGKGADSGDKMDMFFFSLPLNFSWDSARWNFTPWGLYSLIGKNSMYWNDRIPAITNTPGKTTVDDDGTGWWAGFASTFTYDDLIIKGDFAYGSVRSAKSGFNYNASGWFTALAIDYKFGWGTPGVFGWYASGSDADKVERDNTWGHMPTISTFGDGFAPTSFGFKDAFGINDSGVVSWIPSGKWGVGVQVKDISFVERLKHTVRVAYYQGTNDKELAGNKRHLANTRRDFILMTKEDYAVEVNFNHELEIYKNLIMGVDMGYISMHRGSEWKSEQNIDDTWAVNLGFKYRF